MPHAQCKLTWCRADTNSSSDTSAAAPVGRWNFMVKASGRYDQKMTQVVPSHLEEHDNGKIPKTLGLEYARGFSFDTCIMIYYISVYQNDV